MTFFDDYSDPLADHISNVSAVAIHPAPRPAPSSTPRPSYRPAPTPPRPPLKRDPSPGSVPMPAGLSFSIALRRVALAAGMTQEEIDDVMVRLRTKEAGELRAPREWGSTASTAIMSAMSAHRTGTKPPKVIPQPEAAPVIEPQPVPVKPEAAPAVAVVEPDWSGEWAGPLNIVPELLVTVQPEPIVADEDRADEVMITKAPEPSAQPTTTKPVKAGVKPAKERKGKDGTHPKYAFRFSLMADPNLKPSSKLVGIYIADLIDVEVGHAYPGQSLEIGLLRACLSDLRA